MWVASIPSLRNCGEGWGGVEEKERRRRRSRERRSREKDEEEEEEEEDDEDEMGRGVATMASTSNGRLWRSAEARARWLALMTMETIPLHGVSFGLCCLTQHVDAFAPLMQKEPSKEVKARLEGALSCWYHASAFGTVKPKKPGQNGAISGSRFTAAEEKALRDGYNLFGKKDGSGKKDEWIKKTMEKFAFHPSHRTVKSLKQKWQKLNK